jgi:uncharacterized DUF497 family protein
MEFEWDPDKATANERKHGVSFDFAAAALQDIRRIDDYDDQHSDDEERIVSHCMHGVVVYVVVHTLRDEKYRIISARLAVKREQEYYFSEN